MKALVLLGMFLSISIAQAAAPKVSCFGIYTKTDSSGIAVVYENLPGVELTEKLATMPARNGFKIEMKLEANGPVHAPGKAAPTESKIHNLSVEIKNGNATSGVYKVLDTDKALDRISSALSIGNETVFVNCDQTL